ncbi:MAG: hypothetical protein HY735_11670 [Verrucomicrobia bacterium]|nr:hypothetical protein [Verrucomicrobiota bacterium]
MNAEPTTSNHSTKVKPTKLDDNDREILLEVYRQKLEYFRHLDRLRWQTPPLALGVGAAVLAAAKQETLGLLGGHSWLRDSS